jgi:hypothetical protein
LTAADNWTGNNKKTSCWEFPRQDVFCLGLYQAERRRILPEGTGQLSAPDPGNVDLPKRKNIINGPDHLFLGSILCLCSVSRLGHTFLGKNTPNLNFGVFLFTGASPSR